MDKVPSSTSCTVVSFMGGEGEGQNDTKLSFGTEKKKQQQNIPHRPHLFPGTFQQHQQICLYLDGIVWLTDSTEKQLQKFMLHLHHLK